MSPNVLREAIRRVVPTGAVLLQRLHHDPVEIPPQQSLQLGRFDVAVGRDVRQCVGGAEPRARSGRIDLAHHPQYLLDRPPLELLRIDRRRPGQQFVQDHAQGVDISAGVDVQRRWVGLFRRHVGRRADDRPGIGEALVGQPLFRRLGHSEIDHFWRRSAVDLGHQHVARLEVAVNDPLLVRVLHRMADQHEQLQPGPDREPGAVAILGDWHPIHQFHHEERLARIGRAAIVDAGDVRVVHEGQRLPLGIESSQHRPRIHPGLDQFERDLSLHWFGLLGPVDRPHTPLTDHLDQRIAASDHPARGGVCGAVGCRSTPRRNRPRVGRVVTGGDPGGGTRGRSGVRGTACKPTDCRRGLRIGKARGVRDPGYNSSGCSRGL